MIAIRSLLLCLAGLLLSVLAQSNAWVARIELTSNDFQELFNNLTSQGYRLTWMSGNEINGTPMFGAIFEQESGPAWVARIGLTSDEYQQAFNQYTGAGFNLVLVNGYTVEGVDYYAAIWDQSPTGAWVALHGMTSASFQDNFDNYTSQGYRMTHASGYTIGNNAAYAAIWRQTSDGVAWIALKDMTSSEFQTAFDTYTSQGYRLVLLNGYEVAGTDYFIGIWDKSSTGPWYAQADMTAAQFQTAFDEYTKDGLALKVLSSYNTAGLYGGIFETPS